MSTLIAHERTNQKLFSKNILQRLESIFLEIDFTARRVISTADFIQQRVKKRPHSRRRKMLLNLSTTISTLITIIFQSKTILEYLNAAFHITLRKETQSTNIGEVIKVDFTASFWIIFEFGNTL